MNNICNILTISCKAPLGIAEMVLYKLSVIYLFIYYLLLTLKCNQSNTPLICYLRWDQTKNQSTYID